MSALNSSDLPSYGLDDSLVDDDADDPPRYVGRRVPRSLTSHTYETRHQSSATITLLLNTSRSPSASNLPLFYLPATVGGEVQLLLSKKMSIKRIVVTVAGNIVVKPITDGLEWSRWQALASAGPTRFWKASSPNLLFVNTAYSEAQAPQPNLSNASTNAVDIPAGTHKFPFSISIPATYHPNPSLSVDAILARVHAKERQRESWPGSGALGWAKGLLGAGKGKSTEMGVVPATEPPADESTIIEDSPPQVTEVIMPATKLKGEMRRGDWYLHEWSITVFIEMGRVQSDYRYQQKIFVLHPDR